MVRRKPLIYLSLIFSFFDIGRAANNIPLTWLESVKIAREKNPVFLSAIKEIQERQSSYRVSQNGLFPSVDLSSTYSDSESDSNSSRWQSAGSASLDVFNLGTYGAIKSARAERDTAIANFKYVSSQVRHDLKQSFVNFIFSEKQVHVAERVRDIRKQNSELVELKYESGRESKGNMLKAKAELREATANLSQAQRALTVARQSLKRDLGFEDQAVIEATGTLNTPDLPSQYSIQDILKTHPQLQVQDSLIKQSLSQLSEARSPFWPNLSARYSRFATGTDYFPTHRHWSFTGTLSYPIFGSGPTASFYKAAAARANLEQAEYNHSAVEKELATNLHTTWSSLADAIDQVDVQNEFLNAARQRNEEASIRYSSGLMSFEDWERAVADLVDFEKGYIRAQRDASIAESDWEFAKGLTLEDQ
jgi:outer membrane protein TolC